MENEEQPVDAQPITESHRAQIAEGKTRAMIEHGIGIEYHRRTLDSIKDGVKLAHWMRGPARADVREGRGVTFVQRAVGGVAAREAGILTARALNVYALETYVVPMTSIVKWMERPASGGERWLRIQDAHAMVITGFVRYVRGDQESPLTHWQTQELEDFLVARMERGKAVMPVCEVPLKSAKWFSAEFATFVSERNLEFTA